MLPCTDKAAGEGAHLLVSDAAAVNCNVGGKPRRNGAKLTWKSSRTRASCDMCGTWKQRSSGYCINIQLAKMFAAAMGGR